MEIISAVLGALIFFQFEKYLYHHFWEKDLSVDLCFSDEMVVEGETSKLFEIVRNKKLLPLPILKVKFMTSKYLSFCDTDNSKVTDNYYRNDVLSAMMYQKLTRSLSFRCTHRGFFTINNLDIVCCDIFASIKAIDNYKLDLQLYVCPRSVEYNKFQPSFQKMLGTVLTKRYMNEDPFEFRSIREYQSYDSLKAINWKASAKTGSLKVTTNDYTTSQQIKIMLNLEIETIRNYEEIQEESIRLASTYALAFIDQGIPTSICTNALDVITKDILNVPTGSGINHVRTIQETLSRINTSVVMPAFVPVIQKELCSVSKNDYIVIISSRQTEELQILLSDLLHTKTEFSWILPFNNEIMISVSEELMPFVIPWELVLE